MIISNLYDNLKFVNRPWQPIDHELASIMSSYWVNFITSGNPNGKGLPQWPSYGSKDKQIMIVGDKPGAATLPDYTALDFIYARMNRK
jgi:para-nitrobenzyl esterase